MQVGYLESYNRLKRGCLPPGFQRWQLGWRPHQTGEGRFTTPYHDLPEFDSMIEEAYEAHRGLQKYFPDVEWRLVSVFG